MSATIRWRRRLRSRPSSSRPIAAPQVRQYLLERVQDGMNAAKAKGRLADQLATWSVMRAKDEVDKLYDDLRAAGVALPEIVGPAYEVALNQGGRVRAACYVSLSATDPDRLRSRPPG